MHMFIRNPSIENCMILIGHNIDEILIFFQFLTYLQNFIGDLIW